jgi:pyruvate dehydrogenase E2 component (dihydrolipoamide acetyltransferase)
MPSLGADMEHGTVVEWRIAPGDTVHRGDIVAVIETEKSSIEVEVFEDGEVAELLVEEGAEVEVGAPLAVITAAAEGPASPPQQEQPPAPPPEEQPPVREHRAPEPVRAAGEPVVTSPVVRHLAEEAGVDVTAIRPSGPGRHVTRADVERAARMSEPSRPPASPLARRRAAEGGVDLSGVAGSGPGGAVVAADLSRTEPAPSAVPPVGEPQPKAGPPRPGGALRDSIAALMSRSKREIPHYYVTTTIDLDAATTWLSAENAARPVGERLLPAAVLLSAVARAATACPVMNGHWVDGGFRPSDSVDLGVAISLRSGGLVAPALVGADRLSVDELMARLRDLVTRARKGVLRGSEMVEPSITVTNLGDQGVESVLPVIYPPQVAMVGFGKIVERPWAVGGMLTVRPVVTATVAADHRANDGHDGARFLATLDRLLQQPDQL